jgi:hypothetical protein
LGVTVGTAAAGAQASIVEVERDKSQAIHAVATSAGAVFRWWRDG